MIYGLIYNWNSFICHAPMNTNTCSSRLTAVIFMFSAFSAGAEPLTAGNAPVETASTNKSVSYQPIVVTARKWNEPLQGLPGSVTVQTTDMLESAGVKDLRDAASYIPNLTLGDFTVRRLTFPYMRGIGSGRNSAAVTTCIDGVPQLSYATANQQLIDIERIEFLRGPQGSLYGRNTLGGTINILPRLPTRESLRTVSVAAGSFGSYDGSFSIQGPVGEDKTAASLSAGYSTRDGYNKNDMTGNRIDGRESFSYRAQIYWPDQNQWSFRFSVSGESDRDGDYALADLSSLRTNPYHVSHDYEGSSERDLAQPVFTATYKGDSFDFTSISAFQWWDSKDKTDLDTTPADILRRNSREKQNAWIEELRISSPDASPLKLGDRVALRWLLGTLAFNSQYSQRAYNDYRAGAVSMLGIPFPYQQHDDADMEDTGVSLFGQATITFDERVELGLGLRHDYEHRSADLTSYYSPQIAVPSNTDASRDFNQTSPRVSLGYHLSPAILAYVEASKGSKSGGFNAQSPAGHAAFDEETSYSYEAGLKTSWLKNLITANAAVFITDWDNLQMDVPAGMASLYYIDNAGKARSQGAELEITVKPGGGFNIFGGVGLLSSEFRDGSTSGGVDISGKELPFAPETTWNAGSEYTQSLWGQLRGFIRIEAVGTGSYFYDAINGASQESYTLVNARLGVAAGTWRVEGWIKNIFDKDYVPIAFPYAFASSGYVGENGTPQTFGVSFTRSF